VTDDTPITGVEWESLADLDLELVDGDVYLGRVCLGHGPVVRTLLRLVADRATTPPPGFVAQLWEALPDSRFETIDGVLWIGGRNYGRGWHAYLLLLLLAHPPE